MLPDTTVWSDFCVRWRLFTPLRKILTSLCSHNGQNPPKTICLLCTASVATYAFRPKMRYFLLTLQTADKCRALALAQRVSDPVQTYDYNGVTPRACSRACGALHQSVLLIRLSNSLPDTATESTSEPLFAGGTVVPVSPKLWSSIYCCFSLAANLCGSCQLPTPLIDFPTQSRHTLLYDEIAQQSLLSTFVPATAKMELNDFYASSCFDPVIEEEVNRRQHLHCLWRILNASLMQYSAVRPGLRKCLLQVFRSLFGHWSWSSSNFGTWQNK